MKKNEVDHLSKARWRAMNVVVWTGLLFWAFGLRANGQTTVTLDESDTRNLVFTASIGEKTTEPVTFCLNVGNMSSYHRDWYAVSGWFQHQGDGAPVVPVVGIKTSNRLTVYYFKREAPIDTLVNFRLDDNGKYSFPEMMERYHEMDGFLQKMTFEDSPGAGGALDGEWTDGKMQLPIKVYRRNLDILRHHSLLNIHHNGYDCHIDLYALNLPVFYPGEHAVEGYKVVDGKIRIVLSYERASKAYVLGACGAGNEDGFLRLEVDEDGQLLKLDDYRIFSCLQNINYKLGHEDEKLESYIVTDTRSTRFLNFNKETMELEWEEGG